MLKKTLAMSMLADRWDVRKEASAGNREILRERNEAIRKVMRADSRWEARQQIRENIRGW